MEVLSREVVCKRPCTGETRAVQAVRKAEEKLSGRMAWPESNSQVRTAYDWWRGMQDRKDESGGCVQTSRTRSVLDRACG